MSSEPKITHELIAQHGLTPEEFERIRHVLGREPNFTELGIFSVMWSEHCSYKNSKPELKKFPTTGPGVLVRAGEENAGIIDLGDGWAVCFKIESHNHPSAIEPFQGAATGVGGIIRDIFTMGARPIFLLNSLRFGDVRGDSETAKTNRRLLAGVVGGIAHYGNCIGLPTVGGEAFFDDCYNGNPLVNVFCLGVLQHSQIRRGHASGPGNPVFYVGARTGRDGLAGAAFASRDLTEESKQDRPAVQVGDPFLEKLLLEACLELFAHPDAVIGVQDMGAAGLTCSTCETASRGGTGIEIDLARVPQREAGLTPYEIMLSESQERMLIIVRQGHEQVVQDIFQKWDLPCAHIGTVTNDGLMRVKNHGQTVAEIPARPLAEDAPIYYREARVPASLAERQSFDLSWIPEPTDLHATVLGVLAHPSIASKRWIYRQYDHTVRANTVVGPGSDAAVIRVKTGETWKYLATSIDGNARYCLLDPYRGGLIAVAESARNLAMTGAVPVASTDNLNFGNPHHPEIFWQLQQCVNGLAEACRFFNVPVVGGNVSLYNQSPGGAIDPTPTIGLVGLIHDVKHITPMAFQNPGDAIILIGDWGWELAATTYLQEIHGLKRGRAPEIELFRELNLHNQVRRLIADGLIRSAHDISDGGLITTLAECCLASSKPLGACVEIAAHQRLDVSLFNESQSRAVITVADHQATAVLERLWHSRLSAIYLGQVGGKTLALQNGERRLEWTLEELQSAWGETLERIMR